MNSNETFFTYRNGWWGLWKEKGGMHWRNDKSRKTVHWPQRPVCTILLFVFCALIYVVYKCIQTFPHWSQSVHNFFSLYKERLSQLDAKLQEVMSGKAPEYLEPLANLQENMQIRTKVAGRSDVQTEHGIIVVWNCACTWVLFGKRVHCQIIHSCIGIYRELCLESVKNKYDCETQAALQHWEVSFTDVICYYLNNSACMKCLESS